MGHIDLAFEGFRKVTIASIPGTGHVLLPGRVEKRQVEPGQFFIWSPRSQAIAKLPQPPADFEFVAMLGATEVLGRAQSTLTVWDFKANQVRPVTRPDDLDIPSATFDRSAAAALPYAKSATVQGGALSRNGLAALVLLNRMVATPYQLLVYDVRSPAEMLRRPVCEQEIRKNQPIDHVATQIAIAPTRDAVAVSYERQDRAFGYKRTKRVPCWVVYALPAGTQLGTACHPASTVSDGVAAVSPAASGQLTFSPDGRYLYTTSTDTRRWSIR